MLNPLRGSFHIHFITTGFTRGYYCLIPFGIKKCPKDINNNSSPVATGQAVRSSGKAIERIDTTPEWVELLMMN